MTLKENTYYWKLSLENPEPILDDYYIFDNLIIKDEDLLEKSDKLRELIITYCVLLEKQQQDSETTEIIYNDIYQILASVNNIQYHEFVAFWKVLDISYSVFNKLKKQKSILKEIIKKYCEKRRKYYDNLGYSNITIQALYDVGTSRKKGNAANIKLNDLIKKIFNNPILIKRIDEIEIYPVAIFFADRGGKPLFQDFLKKYSIKYEFAESHQGKICDVVLKVMDHFFLIEAKHMKEEGGAQDKQVAEVIEFIKYNEKNEKIHYITFMDGVYFNKFIGKIKSTKVGKQKSDIEKNLDINKGNFFVNTYGLIQLFKDISDTPNSSLNKWIE
jgi:hypothetical protein